MSKLKTMPSIIQITCSVILGVITVLVIGFFVFFGIVASQKPENIKSVSDIAVVLTGGTGRVEAGFDLVINNHTKALFISGVHPDTTLKKLVDLWDGTQTQKDIILNHCCINIGHMADSTENNAAETAAWVKNKNIQTIRIVTSSYHMPRAWLLFGRALPDKTLEQWPVAGGGTVTLAFWRSVLIEYAKTLLTWLA
jgi:uncharacterized SAM-binding protein YcdF (DUF218 family)